MKAIPKGIHGRTGACSAKCAHCPAYVFSSVSRRELVARLRAEGWKLSTRGLNTCPACAGKR